MATAIGHTFRSVELRENARAVLGDSHVHHEYYINGDNIRLEGLLQQLQQTASECRGLKTALTVVNRSYEAALNHDLEHLESLLETLRFHLSESDLALNPTLRQLMDSSMSSLTNHNAMLQDLRRTLSNPALVASDFRENIILATRTSLGDLRRQLELDVMVVTFCTSQAHNDELQGFVIQAKQLLHDLESERALRSLPDNRTPLTSAALADISSERNLVKRRFLHGSSAYVATHYTASMQVSNFEDPASVTQQQQLLRLDGTPYRLNAPSPATDIWRTHETLAERTPVPRQPQVEPPVRVTDERSAYPVMLPPSSFRPPDKSVQRQPTGKLERTKQQAIDVASIKDLQLSYADVSRQSSMAVRDMLGQSRSMAKPPPVPEIPAAFQTNRVNNVSVDPTKSDSQKPKKARDVFLKRRSAKRIAKVE